MLPPSSSQRYGAGVTRAVIFDMDGLLLDSEPLWVRAEMEVFGEIARPLTEEHCALTRGLRTDDVVGYWWARTPWTGPTPAEVEERLIARVASLVRAEGQAKPAARAAVEVARATGRALALASSSPMRIIDAALARLGLEGAFDVVQSAETEPYGKPHPGIFLRTASRLGVEPLACLVLEDSLTGVLAAKSARMACIAVPEAHPAHDARFVIADAIVASLHELTPALMDRLLP